MFFFDVFADKDHLTRLSGIPSDKLTSVSDKLLSTSVHAPSDLASSVNSPNTMCVLMPDVYVDPAELNDRSAIMVVVEPIDITVRSLRNARTLSMLAMSKAIACDYTVWKTLHSYTSARWIDITGCELPLGLNHMGECPPEANAPIHYYGSPNGSFAAFLTEWCERESRKLVLLDGDMTAIDLMLQASWSSIAITPNDFSNVFMTTLGRNYGLTIYPVLNDNSSKISMLDCRGASSVLAGIQHIENAGIGRAGNTHNTWREMLNTISTLTRSFKETPYMEPPAVNMFRRIFNEINRSSF